MASGKSDAGRWDRTAKWVIIVGAVVAALAVIGVTSEGFGLYGVEQSPDMSKARPTP